nr:MAG TPA: hypothetical protein [Caudoviricetes sp.]
MAGAAGFAQLRPAQVAGSLASGRGLPKIEPCDSQEGPRGGYLDSTLVGPHLHPSEPPPCRERPSQRHGGGICALVPAHGPGLRGGPRYS